MNRTRETLLRSSHTWRLKQSVLAQYQYYPFQQLIRGFPAPVKQSRYGSSMNGHGDLNNSHAARERVELTVDAAYHYKTLAIEDKDDDAAIRRVYRPFLLPESPAAEDWVAQLELGTALKLAEAQLLANNNDRIRILILYGSLRAR